MKIIFVSLNIKCIFIFIGRHFRYHACRGRPRCVMCRRQKMQEGDRQDFISTKECCMAEIAPQDLPRNCIFCDRACYDERCLEHHVRDCKTKERCGDCGAVYKRAKDREHK